MSVFVDDVVKAWSEMVLPDGSIAQNVFYWKLEGDSTQTNTDVTDALRDQMDAIFTEIDDWMSDTVVVNPYEYRVIEWDSVGGKWETVRNLGSNMPGWGPDAIQDILPNQMAATCTAGTSLPRSKGRKFFAAFVETAALGGDLIAAALAGLAAAALEWIAEVVLDGTNSLMAGTPREASGFFLEFDSAEANSIMGTQRRRKPGVGV